MGAFFPQHTSPGSMLGKYGGARADSILPLKELPSEIRLDDFLINEIFQIARMRLFRTHTPGDGPRPEWPGQTGLGRAGPG